MLSQIRVTKSVFLGNIHCPDIDHSPVAAVKKLLLVFIRGVALSSTPPTIPKTF